MQSFRDGGRRSSAQLPAFWIAKINRFQSNVPVPAPTKFRKVLSLNDTGETEAHVAGILVPKSDLAFFPSLNPEEKNPRASVIATDPDGRTWNLNFIYYNNRKFGGTRNEYRLTGMTAFFAAHGLRAGDVVELERTRDGLLIRPERRDGRVAPLSSQRGFFESGGPRTPPPSPLDTTEHTIRPAARIIHTIGQNLIKDPQAAVIELVKNAYDADAKTVRIVFRTDREKPAGGIRISVDDDGHGMSYDQVVSTWLVPATADKVTRRKSPGGRQMQGNKGIGRFAAFVLGEQVFLRSVPTSRDVESSLLLEARDFREAQFLDQVRILVEKRAPIDGTAPGTLFEMTSSPGDEAYRGWTKDDFRKLRLDLRRMLFPLNARAEEDFSVWLITQGFADTGQPDGEEKIEPLPVMDQFDYRIVVDVDSRGHASGVFQSPLVVGDPEERLEIDLPELAGADCGPVHMDLRVIDRETTSLQELIDRSKARGDLLSDTNRAQLRRLLDDACGILVFRGDFRIRPYGDQGDDWMELDRERVNNPTLAISNNQTFGVVVIAPEAESHLQEKSARDGLREDEHYERLRAIVRAVVEELQGRRFAIRRSVGRIQRAPRVAEMLKELQDYERPLAKIASILKSEGVAPGKIEKVQDLLREEQKSREQIVAKLEETIAIYAGQATLGKVVGIVLHEGNRGIGILKTQSRRIPELIDELRTHPGPVLMDEILRAMDGIKGALSLVSELFDRIQPLGIRTRTKKGPVRLIGPIKDVIRALQPELAEKRIEVEIDVPAEFEVVAWENDLKAIFFNLVENAIYWLTHPKRSGARIVFQLEKDGATSTRLNIVDNGPGIPRQHVANEDIFEPHFSLRGGIGLGLPIAGEAASRNGFSLKAIHSASGAHFVLDFSPR